ncbi:MAG: DNA polymerase III subunit delta [Proteobacteria bacterium]|nr:DNA polymerase III subunit delta [Pseudomonadota bacterium]MBU1739288.1 DNA polymerase III subunit delta [Pseudomonadota bacterium]
MSVYKRKELPGLFKKIASGETDRMYLLFGERYLCRQAVDELIGHILPDEKARQGALTLVEGDREDPGNTLNQMRTFSMFGGRRVIRVMDSRLLHSKIVAKDLWDKAVENFSRNDREGAYRYLAQVLEIGNVTPDEFDGLTAAVWKSRFGFDRPQEEIGWAVEILSGSPVVPGTKTPSSSGKDITELYMQAFSEGLPAGNILILVTEAVDKRKKFYKYISEQGTVIDLSVETGSGKAAADGQNEVLREIVNRVMAENGKRIEPKTLELLLERVGFHPVAAALESEKLVLYAGDRNIVGLEDLNAVVGRTREEAIYELAEVFSDRNLGRTLLISERLQENGVHPLAIIASLRNHLKKMMLVRSMQELDNPGYKPGMSFPAFKDGYLDRLKKSRVEWPKELSGHPYGLYMTFKKAEKFSLALLTRSMSVLLDAEYNLKGSGLTGKIVLENMFFRLMDDRFPA